MKIAAIIILAVLAAVALAALLWLILSPKGKGGASGKPAVQLDLSSYSDTVIHVHKCAEGYGSGITVDPGADAPAPQMVPMNDADAEEYMVLNAEDGMSSDFMRRFQNPSLSPEQRNALFLQLFMNVGIIGADVVDAAPAGDVGPEDSGFIDDEDREEFTPTPGFQAFPDDTADAIRRRDEAAEGRDAKEGGVFTDDDFEFDTQGG